jgi:heme exporter protein C
MEKLNTPIKLLFGLLMAAATIWSYLVPDAPLFQRPELARIFFWHFPCPMMLTVFLYIGCYFAVRYFLRIDLTGIRPETDPHAKRLWDLRASSALELGMVFAILTMATGMLFSLAQWGALWQWDPRQTSFLIALLIYAAYFALRGAFSDPERRAGHSAAYMLAALLPLTFLIFVFPRLPQIEAVSFHPTDSIMSGNIKGAYAQVIIALLILVSILSAWLYRQRMAVGLLEINENYGHLGKMETGSEHPAPSAVVRPVRVPLEN